MGPAVHAQRLGCILLVVTLLAQHGAGLEFDMLFQTKCVMEEINRNVLVVGDFAAFHKDNSANLVPMSVKVWMPMRCSVGGTGIPHMTGVSPMQRRQLKRVCWHVQVEDPGGSVLYEKKDVTQGQFAFTTKEEGDFKACFTAKGRPNTSTPPHEQHAVRHATEQLLHHDDSFVKH